MHDALQRIEQQMLVAARERARTRRARTRGRVAVLTTVLVLAAASTASAISGVGPVSALLGVGGPPADMLPAAGEPSVTVEQRSSDGTTWTMRAYRQPDGRLCMQAPPVETNLPLEAECTTVRAITDDLEHRGVHVSVATPAADTNLVFGLARGDAAAVVLTDSSGAEWHAALSSAWVDLGTPEEPTAASPRAFIAIVNGATPYVDHPIGFDITLSNGHTLTARWPFQP